MIVLGVESSCDETGLALYDTQHGLLSHALYSQVTMHEEYGGVGKQAVLRVVQRKAGFVTGGFDAENNHERAAR